MTLVSDEARAWIGRVFPPVTIAVGRTDIIRFAIATCDDDPVHHDVAAARQAGHPDLVAPPNFVSALASMSQLMVPRSRLRDDGLVGEHYPPLPLHRIVVGEVVIDFLEDIHAGDEITVSRRLVAIEEREGRSGTMVEMRFERGYVRGDGATVARERYAVIAR